MRKVMKRIAILLGSLLGLIVALTLGLTLYASNRFKPTLRDRPLAPITADTSPQGLARGVYLMENVTGCDGACHSEFGAPFTGGANEINEGPISAVFAVPNITPDEQTGLGNWCDSEIARAIREGVDKDGIALEIMPSHAYHVLSDADVAAIVGYLRSLEPLLNEVPELQMNAFGKIMMALGVMGPDSLQEPILGPQTAPAPGTVEYGAYLVALGGCRDCHQQNLAGGQIPFAEPGAPLAPNLTPAGDLGGWSETDFLSAIRTGVTPGKHILNPEAMPWPGYAGMTDADLLAIYTYLQSLAPVATQ